MKQKARDFFVIVLFLILLPYVLGIMNKTKTEGVTWMNMEEIKEEEEVAHFVKYEDKLSVQEIPLEEFLIGALATTINVEYDLEVLKAQAVLLRSTYYTKLQKQGTVSGQNIDRNIIGWEKVSNGYLTQSQMKKIWKENYEENYKKVVSAVEETKGIIVTYEEHPIEGIYHAMSSGKTRNAKEVFVQNEYTYLESVLCEKNVESQEFLQSVAISKETLNTLIIEQRDTAGYVISLICNGEKITGEQFRKKYELASANFTFTEKENEFIIETKGSGHGLGMDQYYSNYLAENDYSYTEILDYFFKDTKLSKMKE